MAIVIKLGMKFDENSVPNFGSIRMTHQRGNNVNDYIFKVEDLSKLSLITNAAEGSTALASDTADIYILHVGEWVKLGGEDATRTLSMSPLNINRAEITSDIGESTAEIEPSTEELR